MDRHGDALAGAVVALVGMAVLGLGILRITLEYPMTSAKSIDAFLDNPSIAVVGVSRSGKGFGNAACRSLRTQGYRVYPVNWAAPTVDGMRCYSRLSELPERVNAVLGGRGPAAGG